MELDNVLDKVRSPFAASRVYGEPVVRNGVTIIPAARIIGGGGAGSDEASDSGGGGFGVGARPAGALIIDEDGKVRWKVPFDLNKVILGGQLVGIAFFLFGWMTQRSQARAAAKVAIATALAARHASQ